MKNFRKVLALILVVATLFSFVAMASAKSATEYTDYADVKNVEAVDVLTALGIINGYDGAFHPADTIDRDEMAKMIAVLRNAGDFDADLYASANKFADVKGQWAEGYVAYCAQLGIIAGYNATTFAPDAAVKAVEVAKMLLCTLGFNAEKQGYVGANWEVAVIRDATKYGIIPADVNPYEAATRDDAAQMFLNALQANMVAGYLSENIVYVTNSLYAAKPDPVNGKPVLGGDRVIFDDISLKEAEKDGWEVAYGNAVISATPLWTIYGNLELSETVQYDCYGRPGHVWTVKAGNNVVFQKFYAATPIFSATDADTADVAAAVKAFNKVTDATVEWWINGQAVTAANEQITGQGALTEIYKTGANALRVVVVDTFIAEVEYVSEMGNYFTVATKAQIDSENTTDYQLMFALNDYEVEEGDMVLLNLCRNKNFGHGTAANTEKRSGFWTLHNMKVVEPVIATVTEGYDYAAGTLTDDYVVADGKTYEYNYILGTFYGTANWPILHDDVYANPKVELYLDEYGYILYWQNYVPETEYKYAYVVEKTAKEYHYGLSADTLGAGTSANNAWDATVVNYGANGALTPEEKFAIDEATFDMMVAQNTQNWTDGEGLIGRLVKYSYDAKGKFVLKTDSTFAAAGSTISKDTFVVREEATGANVYASSKTIFMVRTKNLDGTYTYTQYTDYATLPGTYVAENLTGRWLDGSTNIQYIDADANSFAEYVFIDAKYETAACDHFMLVKNATYKGFQLANSGKIYTKNFVSYEALVDGVKSVVLLDEDDVAAGAYTTGVMYEDVLQWIGVAFDANGGKLPVYADSTQIADDDDRVIPAVDMVYTVEEGEAYAKVGTAMYKITGETKTYTVTGTLNTVTNKYDLSIVNGLYVKGADDKYGMIATEETVRGYLFDIDGDKVAEEIVLVNKLFESTVNNF